MITPLQAVLRFAGNTLQNPCRVCSMFGFVLVVFTNGAVGRDNKACRKRWIHSLDPKLRKGTSNRDLLLCPRTYVWFQRPMVNKRGRSPLRGC